MRGTRGWGTAVVVLALLASGSASASSAAAESLLPPPGFHLRASNGYSLSVLGLTVPENGKNIVLVLVGNGESTVLYATPVAVLVDDSIVADLGSVGRIDVHFAPSGRSQTERLGCSGKPETFAGGRYEGVIDFDGEQGYSKVHATVARGDGRFFQRFGCGETGGSEGRGGRSPGARLEVQGLARQLVAVKTGPSRRVRLTASIREQRGEMEISRRVDVVRPPSAFAFDFPTGIATVAPPSPFSGRGVYRRLQDGGSTWRGNLSVDFPGRPGVKLNGGYATLERVVRNPGHPF
jgi:hypothetical protein